MSSGVLMRRAAAVLGFPPGTGELIDGPTRRKLVVSLGYSVLLALLDMAGVAAMLPMMQYITGQPTDTGTLGIVSSALGDPSEQALVAALGAMIVGAFVVKDVAALFIRRWQLTFMAGQQVQISSSMLQGYLTSPYSWHLRQSTADKLWIVQGAVSMGYAAGIAAALASLTEMLTIGFIFASLVVISPPVTAAAVIYFGLVTVVLQALIRPRVQKAGARSLAASQAASGAALQPLTAVKEIKLRRAHRQFISHFRATSEAGAEASVSAAILNEVPKYVLEIAFVIGVGGLAVVAASGNDRGDGVVVLGVFVAAGTRIVPSAVRLINAFSAIRFARPPMEQLVGLHRLMRQHRADEELAVRTQETPSGDIIVEGLRFGYEGTATEVLKGVDLRVPSGSSLAVVGSSGAGKTTLVDILLGLHRPTAGDVKAGPTSIFDNVPGWQRSVAVVPQDVTLLDTSIRLNIAFDEEVDPERLDAAVVQAQLADLIQELPHGLDTRAGEGGIRLSGGQRQRIGIARALYRRPELLVMDEATSALDNATERRLTETIDGLSGQVTVVVVAHRLSTVQHCDQLIFMSDGRIASAGTFDQVRAENAEFAHLVSLGSLGD